MKKLLVLALACNLISFLFSDEVIINPSTLEKLIIEENSYECLDDFFNKNRNPKLSISKKLNIYSMPENELVEDGNIKFNISFSKINYNTESKELTLAGYVTGNLKNHSDTVMIFAGRIISGVDSLIISNPDNPPDNPIILIETLNINNPQIFRTSQIQKDKEMQLFNISLKIEKEYVMIFCVENCNAKIYRIGKLIQ